MFCKTKPKGQILDYHFSTIDMPGFYPINMKFCQTVSLDDEVSDIDQFDPLLYYVH